MSLFKVSDITPNLVFPKVFLIPQVVMSATRAPAMAGKSSACDLTNKGPRRVKIPSEAAAYSR